jgi:hypothetical protein
MATEIVLSTGEWVKVPEGADPEAYRKYREAGIRLAANPKKRKTRSSRSGSGSGRRRKMQATRFLGMSLIETTARATAEALDRVNGGDEGGLS